MWKEYKDPPWVSVILHVYLNTGARVDFKTSFCYLIQCSLLLSLCLFVYYLLFKNCNSKIISRAPSGANQWMVCVCVLIYSITHSYTPAFLLRAVVFCTHRVVVFGALLFELVYKHWLKAQTTPFNRPPKLFPPCPAPLSSHLVPTLNHLSTLFVFFHQLLESLCTHSNLRIICVTQERLKIICSLTLYFVVWLRIWLSLKDFLLY